jgi:hypothetical protein
VNVSQPVERVVALLREAGYERLPVPVAVAGIPFEFSAVLAARSSLDLIVVVDTVTETDVASIRRRVQGLSRALDLVESRRPLTVVVIGPDPLPELQVALTRVARVLMAGVPGSERELREAVAVLLPLELVTAAELPESWRSARDKLLTAHPNVAEVLEAAKMGAEEVAKAARTHLLGSSTGGEGNR